MGSCKQLPVQKQNRSNSKSSLLPSTIQENPKHPAVESSDVPFLNFYFYSRCSHKPHKVLLLPRQRTEYSPRVKRAASSSEHFTQHQPNTCFCALSNIHHHGAFWEPLCWTLRPLVTHAVESEFWVFVTCLMIH